MSTYETSNLLLRLTTSLLTFYSAPFAFKVTHCCSLSHSTTHLLRTFSLVQSYKIQLWQITHYQLTHAQNYTQLQKNDLSTELLLEK